MTEGKYILDAEGNPVPCEDLMTWAKWFQEAGDSVRVALDQTKEGTVSTIFLGLDHSFGVGNVPLLYETMVFTKDSDDQEQIRYPNKEEALRGHKQMVEKYLKIIDVETE